MIFRTGIICPGCKSKIRLRIGLGIDEIQPFYIVCKQCQIPIKGKIVLSKKIIEIEDGSISTECFKKDVDQTVTIHTDFPVLSNVDEMWEVGGSPFIYQVQLMGNDNFSKYKKILSSFLSLRENNWSNFKRFSEYYLNKNWKQFDTEGEKLIPTVWQTPTREFERHNIYHIILELFFAPLFVRKTYPNLKKEYSFFINKVIKKDKKMFDKYTAFLLTNFDIDGLQRDIIERLYFFVENFNLLKPAFVIYFYDESNVSSIDNLRVLRDDFDLLKGHYLDTFEICHKILPIAIGLENIYQRGYWNSFIDNKPKTLNKYKKLRNFEKPTHIINLKKLKDEWEIIFDRQLRNLIGHKSIRHNLKTGNLISDKGENVPYVRFLLNSFDMISMLLFASHVLKMVHISNTIYKKT